jgi:hypothetical protein
MWVSVWSWRILRRIDGRFDGTRYLALRVEEMPELAGGIVEAGDPRLTVLPAKHTAIGKLAAAARIERRYRQDDFARPGIDDLGLHDQGLGLFMAEKMHAEPLPQGAAELLAEIAYAAAARANCRGVMP